MANGRGLYTPVVFTLSDLKEIYDRDAHGKKGMWCFHSKFHPGHAQNARMVNKKCDWVVGILWNNFAAGMEWMLGKTIDVDTPIYTTDIEVLKNMSDVVMVFTGDYHPYDKHWHTISQVIKERFPDELLIKHKVKEQYNLYSSLIYSIAVRMMIHEIYGIKLDYQCASGRDLWRHVGYTEWVKERFGLTMDISLDAARDETGNVYSGMKNKCPEKYTKRINKPLLLPNHKTIEEVREHIKDISELEIVNFAVNYGWVHGKFEFAGKHWWTEGLKVE